MIKNKRGVKPKNRVKIKWSSDFAYAIGLIATDGCVYRDGSHVNLTSKDKEQIINFKKALHLNNKISMKSRGGEQVKKYYVIQFGDVTFVHFLKSIGIGPAKSKTLNNVIVPDKFFFDFLRGCFDGDGTCYSYWDKRWKSSFMYYIAFASASLSYVDWLQGRIYVHLGVKGHITSDGKGNTRQLRYAKNDSLMIIRRMYHSNKPLCLARKRLKIKKILAIVGESLE